MAKAQYAIDGLLGKDWKVTSYMGWRMHPIKKVKKFHNGTDIISTHDVCWIEAPYDAKVVKVGNNPSGFGNSVLLQMKINGKYYTSIFAHMADGSVKVRNGQKIKAGTPLGKMGSTGMSTGRHLHWELQLGKAYHWNDIGKDFIEPVKFFKALIAHEKAIASAKVVAKDTDPVAPAPVHDEAHAAKVEAQRLAEKNPTPTPTTAPAAKKPATAPATKPIQVKIANPGYPGAYIKAGSTGTAVKYLQQQLKAPITGKVDVATLKAIKALQARHDLKVDGIVGPLTWAKLG